MEKEIYDELNSLSDEINQLYGFVEDTPCINYGPCGVFAYLFYHEWGFNEISLNNKKQKKAMTSMSDTDKYCLFWYN